MNTKGITATQIQKGSVNLANVIGELSMEDLENFDFDR